MRIRQSARTTLTKQLCPPPPFVSSEGASQETCWSRQFMQMQNCAPERRVSPLEVHTSPSSLRYWRQLKYSSCSVHDCYVWHGPSKHSRVVCTENYFLGVKRPDLEAGHSPQRSAEVKNAWSFNFTPPYLFMTQRIIMWRVKFINF
jgi:hypothetical protein